MLEEVADGTKGRVEQTKPGIQRKLRGEDVVRLQEGSPLRRSWA